jgi:nucleoside-diphosphate-sugar epimerase
MARRGAPVIIVLPGAVYGPGDESALARQLRCIAAGRARAIPAAAGVFPYTHVDDVVEGMLLAWEKGRPGESYLLAGENLSLEEFYQQAARAAGVKPPRWRLPRGLTRLLSWWYDFLPGGELLTGGLPMSREAVAMVLDANWAYSSAKAQKELGWRARSFQEGLADTLAALRSAFLG